MCVRGLAGGILLIDDAIEPHKSVIVMVIKISVGRQSGVEGQLQGGGLLYFCTD